MAKEGEGKYKSTDQTSRKKDKNMAKNSGGDMKQMESKQTLGKNAQTYKVKNNDTRKSDKQQGNYQGDMYAMEARMKPPQHDNYVVVNHSIERRSSKKISKYQGDMQPMESRMEGPRNSTVYIKREIDHKEMKKVANYSGDIPANFLAKRAKHRREMDKKLANYRGDITVRSLMQRDKKIRKKGKDMANYQGDIIVHKRKKGMHPSSVYRGGKIRNSYQQKEKYRKKMLKKYGRNPGIEDPNYLKKKEARPKYDKRESEIWY